jgi:hypothetical protein
VLSHLTEQSAKSCLSELKSLLRHNGIALLSFNGLSNSASYLSRRPAEFARVIHNNLFDADWCKELDGYIEDAQYYRASFSSDEYWISLFRQYFEIIAVEYSVVSGHQHMAVLRNSL